MNTNKQEKPCKGDIYHHFKGTVYEVLNVGVNTETMEEMVIYRESFNTNSTIWIRPLDQFISEVDRDKYPNVKQKYRFKLLQKGKR